MKPSLEKLQRLWNNRASLLRENSPAQQRANRLYALLEQWQQQHDQICTLPDFPTPKAGDIPTDKWAVVKANFHRFYRDNPPLDDMEPQIEEIAEFLHLQQRDGAFRLSSQANSDSAHEVVNTEPTTFKAPETWFGSYNYPFEIIQYLLGCGKLALETFRGYPPSRFIFKFLWMLARRAEVLPILSLRSFRSLAPLFKKYSSSDWGAHQGHWNLSLAEFQQQWPAVSNGLCQDITGDPYHLLTAEKQRELTTILFIASVADTTTKNGLEMLRTGNQAMIFYGPPGTGKTHHAQEVARELLELGRLPGKEEEETPSPMPLSKESFAAANFTSLFGAISPATLNHGCWELVQFHPSYSYQDFIGGIMPDVDGTTVAYHKIHGIFKRFCDRAREFSDWPFVFMIDEINRADLSAVFGELLFAIEYRGRTVNLPHFGPFDIPKNVFIIGTMNISDKSLVTFDLALRRRFLFFKLKPDLHTLEDWNDGAEPEKKIHSDDLAALIASGKALNLSLVDKINGLRLPEDYGIGQAYFMKIRDFCVPGDDELLHITDFARERLWDYYLEPLLEEYLGAEVEEFRPKLTEFRQRFVRG